MCACVCVCVCVCVKLTSQMPGCGPRLGESAECTLPSGVCGKNSDSVDYSARMNPESTHKLMGFYMESRRYTLVHGFCFVKPFPIG